MILGLSPCSAPNASREPATKPAAPMAEYLKNVRLFTIILPSNRTLNQAAPDWGSGIHSALPQTTCQGRRPKVQFNSYGPYIATGKVTEQYDAISITAESFSHG
jgi:hypothetical protein